MAAAIGSSAYATSMRKSRTEYKAQQITTYLRVYHLCVHSHRNTAASLLQMKLRWGAYWTRMSISSGVPQNWHNLDKYIPQKGKQKLKGDVRFHLKEYRLLSNSISCSYRYLFLFSFGFFVNSCPAEQDRAKYVITWVHCYFRLTLTWKKGKDATH